MLVCHFDATTPTGEDVHVTLASNTVILRFPLDGEEQEWAKTEHRWDFGVLRPALDEEFAGAVIEAVRTEGEEHEGFDITLTNPDGDTANVEAAWYPDEEWGRIYGPIYGKAPAAPVVA